MLLRDDIPLNARLEWIDEAAGHDRAVSPAGDALHDYVTTMPDDAREVDAVAFFLAGDFPVGWSATVGFSVAIDEALGAVEVENTAIGFLPTADGVAEQPSNTVSVALAARHHRHAGVH